MERAPNLRMIALASTVALAVALPLAAATAGPAGDARSAPETVPGAAPGAGSGKEERSGTGAAASPAPERASGADGVEGSREESGGLLQGLGLEPGARGRRVAECGPELASPHGVEAQTCVLAENDRTWARTYYRNTSGEPLNAVLTLMRPNGRTVQIHCEVPAGDEPGSCETPAETEGGAAAGAGPRGADSGAAAKPAKAPGEPSQAGREAVAYGAVAEFSDAAQERLLLRSGSNSAAPGGGSRG